MKKKVYLLLVLGVLLALLLFHPKIITGSDGTFVYPGKGLYALIISEDGSTLYAPGNGGISIIDVATMQIIDELPFSYDLAGIVVSPTEDYVYCTYYAGEDGTGMLARVRISDGDTETIDLSPVNVADVTMDDSGDYLYVAGGLWPHIGVGVRSDEYNAQIGTGRIIEVDTDAFNVTRVANVGVENGGISYQNGKLVVMTSEQRVRPAMTENLDIMAFTCYIVDAATLHIEHTVSTGLGFHNTSFTLPENNYIMMGWNNLGVDDVGMGLLNVNTGEVENWITTYLTGEPNKQNGGGAYRMTVDESASRLYCTFFVSKDYDVPYSRIGVVDLSTLEYRNWYIQGFRRYLDIAYNPVTDKIYLTAPLDDVIVALDPPA